jgi:hypothetical protein
MAGLINCMGRFWSPQLVSWGPRSKQELLGVCPYRFDNKRGPLSKAQRGRQTIDFWNEPAVYGLFRGDEVVYIGKALALGERLWAHHSFDHLVGRWDSFSWVSPTEIEKKFDKAGTLSLSPNSPLKDDPDGAMVTGPASLTGWMSEVEALAILFATPFENRQVPRPGDHHWFFEQARSEYAQLTTDEMIRHIYEKVVAKDG